MKNAETREENVKKRQKENAKREKRAKTPAHQKMSNLCREGIMRSYKKKLKNTKNHMNALLNVNLFSPVLDSP